MARGRAYNFQSFARGLNTADSVFGLADGFRNDPTGRGAECRDCLNVISRTRGSIRKRPGSSLFANIGAAVTPLDVSVVAEDAAPTLIFGNSDGTVRASSAAGAISTVKTAQSTTAGWRWVKGPTVGGQGPYFGMNGTNTPQQWAGSGAAATWTITGQPSLQGKFMVIAGNRLWVAGDPANPYSVSWSDPGDFTSFPAANVTKFDPFDGQQITGLGTLGPYVVVFKQSRIYVIYDLTTSANRRLSDKAGTLSPGTIVPTEQGLFFLDPDRGVMVTDGQGVRRIGEQIQPTFDRAARAAKQAATAAFVGAHYYLCVALDGGSTFYLIDYDTELDSWWLHTTNAKFVCAWDYGSGRTLIGAGGPITGRANGGLLHLMDSTTFSDEGTAFTSKWSGPFHDFAVPHLQKRIREVHVIGKGTIDVFYATEFDQSRGSFDKSIGLGVLSDGSTFAGANNFAGVGTFGGGVTLGFDRMYSLGRARAWSLTFTDTASLDWEIDSYVMLVDVAQD